MFDAQVLAFCIVALVVTITPGADTMLVLRNTLRGGQRDGLITSFGICNGLYLHATLSALGVSAILAHSATAFYIVKLAGAGYLVWLGLQSLKSAWRNHKAIGSPEHTPRHATVSFRRSFLEGFLSNTLNPKVAVFYLAFLPQFIGPADPVLAKSLLLAAIHYVIGIAWLVALVTMLARAREWVRRPGVRRFLDGMSGTILTALGLRLALEQR